MKLILRCNPGLEDITAAEASQELKAKVLKIYERKGRVDLEINNEDYWTLVDKVQQLRSIHHSDLVLAEGEVERLEDVYKIVKEAPLDDFILSSSSFAVRAERVGKHSFTSMDVARVAGSAIIDSFLEAGKPRPKVDLDHPDVVVTVYIIGRELVVGVRLTGDDSHHRRGYRVYSHPAALKPSIAYGMIILSGARDGEVLLDPMCGGGTICIEAALLFENSSIIGVDIDENHVRGAVLNAIAANVKERIRFIRGDARNLEKILSGDVDRMISNPPYGIRLCDLWTLRKLYVDFIESASKVLSSDGTITLITTEHKLLKKEAPKYGLEIVHERVVAHGGLWPKIVVFRKAR